MTNQPRRDDRPSHDAMSRGGQARDGTDQVLSLLSGREQQDREEARRIAQDGERDWSAALTLLHRAGEAIRANAERAETMETHARALWARASEEIERGRRGSTSLRLACKPRRRERQRRKLRSPRPESGQGASMRPSGQNSWQAHPCSAVGSNRLRPRQVVVREQRRARAWTVCWPGLLKLSTALRPRPPERGPPSTPACLRFGRQRCGFELRP
jgi:hypothetical protein